MLTIIGPSGSGKSTLLRCVNLLEPLNSGRIFFEGEEITRKGTDLSATRQRIGMVFQQFNLFPHLTVMNNLTLAARRIRRQPRAEAEARAHGAARAGRADGEGGPAPAPALRRSAAAGRDRPRADDGSARDALRRGHVRARPGARRRGADRDARPGARRHDDARRHARDAVRARGRRPRRSSWTRAASSSRACRPMCSTARRRSAPGASCIARSSLQARSRSCQSPTRKEHVHEEDPPGHGGGGRRRGLRRHDRLRPAHCHDRGGAGGGCCAAAEASGRTSRSGSGSSSASSAMRRRSATSTSRARTPASTSRSPSGSPATRSAVRPASRTSARRLRPASRCSRPTGPTSSSRPSPTPPTATRGSTSRVPTTRPRDGCW